MSKNQNILGRLEGTFTIVSATADLAIVLGAVLKVILGIDLNQNTFITATIIGFVTVPWLIYSTVKAYKKIKLKGNFQNPKWFWRLILGRIITEPKPLSKASVIIIVPPKLKATSDQIKTNLNKNKNINFSFHYLPVPKPNTENINEDDAKDSQGNTITVKTFNDSLENFTSIILFDNGDWDNFKDKYPLTWTAINDWSNRNTSHPIISIQVGEHRTFKYSWGELSEVKRNDQALSLYLLDQAVIRANAWESQSKVQRRTFRAMTIFLIIVLLVSLGFNYHYKNERDQTERRSNSLKIAMTKDINEQLIWSENLESYRKFSSQNINKSKTDLLTAFATQLQKKVVQSSGMADTNGVDVILFALKKTWDKDNPSFQYIIPTEVAATRTLRSFNFSYKPGEPNIHSIVGCSASNKMIFYWTASDELGTQTKEIKAWNLTPGSENETIGEFNDKKWTYGENDNKRTCDYYDPRNESSETKKTKEAINKADNDDARKYLLCAPVGVADNSTNTPVGAICISSYSDLRLYESWARQLIINYGNSLSFFDWQDAISQEKQEK